MKKITPTTVTGDTSFEANFKQGGKKKYKIDVVVDDNNAGYITSSTGRSSFEVEAGTKFSIKGKKLSFTIGESLININFERNETIYGLKNWSINDVIASSSYEGNIYNNTLFTANTGIFHSLTINNHNYAPVFSNGSLPNGVEFYTNWDSSNTPEVYIKINAKTMADLASYVKEGRLYYTNTSSDPFYAIRADAKESFKIATGTDGKAYRGKLAQDGDFWSGLGMKSMTSSIYIWYNDTNHSETAKQVSGVTLINAYNAYKDVYSNIDWSTIWTSSLSQESNKAYKFIISSHEFSVDNWDDEYPILFCRKFK